MHANRIVGAWKHAKDHFRHMNGTSIANCQSHLCEIMFRNCHNGQSPQETIKMIKEVYSIVEPCSFTCVRSLFNTWFLSQAYGADDSISRRDSSCDSDDNESQSSVASSNTDLEPGNTSRNFSTRMHTWSVSYEQ